MMKRIDRLKKRVVRSCPECGGLNLDEASFCMACGTALTAGQRRADSRRVVTVLFTDVVRSTALGERLDPESLRAVMAQYFDRMRGCLEAHRGTVEKYIGDAIMAVFGLPVLHEDDALRAVRPAADMRTALADLNRRLNERWGVTVEARTGINTGEVVAGGAGSPQPLVTGEAVNVAARLEQAAEPGEIIIGAATYRLVRDAVVVDPLGSVEVRGRSRGVDAFVLRDVTAGAPGTVRRFDSPLVGRRPELETLVEARRRSTREGSCHLFTVLGAAGIGKSRLVNEFVSTTLDESLTLVGRCPSYGEGITFLPVAEMVRAAAGIDPGQAIQESRAHVAHLLRGDDRAESVVDRLEQMLGATTGATAIEELFWSIRRFVEALAQRRPLTLVFEDLQWAEPALLDMVENIAEWSRGAPILLLCVARHDLLDRRPGWAGGKLNAITIQLEPLTDEDAALLIDNLTHRAALPDGLRTRITASAEGNPLFVEEMFSKLVDDGLLEPDRGGWVGRRSLSDIEVPATIQALLAARLDQLGGEERTVIEAASVIGRAFNDDAVMAMSSQINPRVGRDHLLNLLRKELIRPVTAGAAAKETFRFRHHLIQRAAYDATAKEARAAMHEMFAGWIERELMGRIPGQEEVLGYHLERAHTYLTELGERDERVGDLAVRAAVQLGAAGRHARARGDAAAAVNLLTRAAPLSSTPIDRTDLLIDLVSALKAAGDFGRAGEVVDELIGLAEAADDVLRAKAVIEQHSLAFWIDPSFDTDESRAVTANAIDLLTQAGDHSGLADAWRHRAELEWARCRGAEAAEAFRQSGVHARLSGDQVRYASACTWEAVTLASADIPLDRAMKRLNEIRVAARGLIEIEEWGLIIHGLLLAKRGDIDEGRRMHYRGREMLREKGVLVTAAASSFVTGIIEVLAGRPEIAEGELRSAYETLSNLGESGMMSTVVADLAQILVELDNLDEADHFAQVAKEVSAPGDLQSQSGWRAARARLLASRGEHDHALALLEEVTQLLEDTDFADEIAENDVATAEVLWAIGRRDEAGQRIRRALESFESRGAHGWSAYVRRRLDKLDPVLGGQIS